MSQKTDYSNKSTNSLKAELNQELLLSKLCVRLSRGGPRMRVEGLDAVANIHHIYEELAKRKDLEMEGGERIRIHRPPTTDKLV